jgi:hypothetical protein
VDGGARTDRWNVLANQWARNAPLLAGWERGNQYAVPTKVRTNFSGTAEWGVHNGTAAWATEWSRWSNDGTFGSLVEGAQLSQGAYLLLTTSTGTTNSYLRFTVTNESSEEYALTYLCFDAWRAYNSMNTYSVSIVGGDFASTNNFSSGFFTRFESLPAEGGGNYEDVDISLAALENNILAPEESVTFELSFNAATAGGQFYVDNVAVLVGGAILDVSEAP